MGTDRIVELQFSDGQYRLFLEFYAGGNIVLTDKELSILALFRIVSEGHDQEELRVGLNYSLNNRQNYNGVPQLSEERVIAGLQRALDKGSLETATHAKKSKRKPGDALRKALATSLSEFPPMLLDHALRVADFDAATRVDEVLANDGVLKRLMLALEEAKYVNESISSLDICKGFIIAKSQKRWPSKQQDETVKKSVVDRREGLIYEDFQPFRPRQFEDDSSLTILEFDGFNKTVDEFFSSIESLKLESRLTEREEHARKKLQTAKHDHEKRLGGLQQVQELNVRKAQAVEGNLQSVQEAIAAVNSLVAQSIGWPEIARLIEMEQQRHNPVAKMIKLPLKLYENTVTLLLAEADFEDEDDFEGNETDSDVSDSEDEDAKRSKPKETGKPVDKRLAVDVDLALSPWSNARQYYDQKKNAAVKEQRTLQSSETALKSTERKINADLQKGLKQEKDVMRPQRKAMWFEKFVYFMSSEGYLVLGGKDAQQNEIIYKRCLKKGDAYIHADLQGATSVIVKNKPGKSDDPIPPSTLSQAGTLAICTSSAWDSKAVMSAWWVHAEQVSKTAATGEYLQSGSFTIKGHKNFLPPAQLLLGFGLMFKVSEDSKARHLKHRVQEDDEVPTEATPEIDDTMEDLKDMSGVDSMDNLEAKQTDGHEHRTGDEDEEREDESTEVLAGEGDRSEDDDEDESGIAPRFDNPLQSEGSQHGPAKSGPTAPLYEVTSSDESEDESQLDAVDAEPHQEQPEPGEPDADEALEAGDVESNHTVDKDSAQGIRHLSARERRLQRRGRRPEVSEQNSRISTPATSAPSQASSKPATSLPRVRGKKGEHNKLKTKYADQDEEDRALAMRLLGSAAAQEKAKEDTQAKASKEQEVDAAKERRRKQHATAAEKGKEAEAIRRLKFEGGNEAIDEDELEKMEDLDSFVGVPLPGDEILDALVVCGPWDAIGGRCRWRVKLQPGPLKKGKAVREILGAWNAALTAWDKKKRPGSGEGNTTSQEEDKVRRREAELVRAIREPEVIGIVPVGKVRVMMGAVDGIGKGRGGGGAGKGKRGGKGSKRR